MKEITIDCVPVQTPGDLHTYLAAELDLPEWYGRNLDALYDCLTELEEEIHLIVRDFDSLPFAAEGFLHVFEDAAIDNPLFAFDIM